jgi:hypothetical protein
VVKVRQALQGLPDLLDSQDQQGPRAKMGLTANPENKVLRVQLAGQASLVIPGLKAPRVPKETKECQVLSVLRNSI